MSTASLEVEGHLGFKDALKPAISLGVLITSMFSEASLNYNRPLLSVFISILTALLVLKIFRCCDRVDMPTWGYFRHQLSSPFPSCNLCLHVCITLRSLLTGHPNQKSTAYFTWVILLLVIDFHTKDPANLQMMSLVSLGFVPHLVTMILKTEDYEWRSVF